MWQAKFNNGEVLKEFDANGNEVVFKKVSDRFDDLADLSIVLADRVYTVRMADGRFSTISNGDEHHFFALDEDAENLTNIRPIYFIRESVNFGTQGNSAPAALGPPEVEFVALGFQANLEGHNVKRYLTIFPDGTTVLRDK